LYDEARFAYAQHCIARGDVPIEAIAVALGFSEPSAFHRAFRRWSGTTPQAFARTLRLRLRDASANSSS
jgi:AraC-like DNA-binding protein